MQIAFKRHLPVVSALVGVLTVLAPFPNALPVLAEPAQVILIRHAEKPKDSDALHLSKAGRKRAEALVPYLETASELTQAGLPVALFGTEPTKHGKGQRPAETLEPLSRELKLPIQTPFKSDEYKKLAQFILREKEYDGKSVVVCWTHEYIPALAGALGVHPKPARLDEKTYDKVYLITYEGGKAALKELCQPPPSDKDHDHGDKKHAHWWHL
jgi:hypothetical protein